MSSQLQSLVALVRERPEFAVDVLREILRVEVPMFTEARFIKASFDALQPAECHADAVVLFSNERAVFGCIIEALPEPLERKRFTWPVYAVHAWARFKCPFVLVVFTADQATAAWAADSIDLGPCCPDFRPLVVGPEGVRVVADAT